jgi:hypothetical protein
VVVAVEPAPDDFEPSPPLAASATPAPPSAIAIAAVAITAVYLCRNTREDLLSSSCSDQETGGA